MTRLRTSNAWLVKVRTGLVAYQTALVAVGVSSASIAAATTRPATAQIAHGTASVACAGSLLKLYEDTLGPAFKRATGDSFGGPPWPVPRPCLGNPRRPDQSRRLHGHRRQGHQGTVPGGPGSSPWRSADPLVVAFSKKSRYSTQLNEIRLGQKPLSYLFTLFKHGFKLGRTDPTQDPQGIFFILFAKLAEKVLKLSPGEATAPSASPRAPVGSASQLL